MQKIQIVILLLLFIFPAKGFSAEPQLLIQRGTRVLPEIATKVELSNSDVNRIICPTPITDIVHSQEKGIKIHYTKKDAYLKFEIIKIDEKLHYSQIPSELFITCGESVYHIIAVPKKIPSQIIHLASGTTQTIKKNQAYLRGLPYEEKVLKLIKAVYTNDIPDSFTIHTANKAINLYRNLKVTHIRTIKVEGEGFLIKEYVLKPKDVTGAIALKEGDFLRSEFTLRPVALSIDILSLKPGHTARMIIIERQGGQFHG